MDIFAYSYMKKAFLVGSIVGIICPATGLFIVIRRMSLIGDALAHISLAGVAAGLMAGVNPVISAFVFSAAAALFIEKLREKYSDYSDLAVAIILSLGLALGAVLLSYRKGFNANVFNFLFGSIVVQSDSDFLLVATAGFIVITFIFLIYKELCLISIDEDTAKASGVAVKKISISFTLLTSLTIAVAMRTVGILLVSSLMVIPVATALHLAKSLRGALFLSIALSLSSVISGLFISFYLDLAAGGSIIIISIVFLCLGFCIKGLVNNKGNELCQTFHKNHEI